MRKGQYLETPLPEFYQLLMNNFAPELCKPIYNSLTDNQVFINPTLLTRRNDYYIAAGLTDTVLGLEHVHYLIKLAWQEDVDNIISYIREDQAKNDIESFKLFYQQAAKTIASAQKAGVKILAGTDSYDNYIVPGFSLHEELQALIDAGIDNYSVLQAATINGAEYFKMADKVGSIDIGKKADMVLLAANPIDNIKHTQAISTVFKGQAIYHHQDLVEIKNKVKESSQSHTVTARVIGLWLQNLGGF